MDPRVERGVTQTSISFDHAADFYDATRALPPHVQAAIADVTVGQLREIGATRMLEVGVGTGRMARPVAERGVRVCGVDIAPRMLARLCEQIGPQHTPPDLLLADATALPLRSASCPAVFLCHVLHLIPGWRDAVAEMRRVLPPGGLIIQHHERVDPPSAWEASAEKWNEMLAARRFERRKRPSIDDMAGAFRECGGTSRTLEVARWDETCTPAEEIDLIRNRIHSWTWEIPREILFGCLPELEGWARERFGGLDRRFALRWVSELQVWRFE